MGFVDTWAPGRQDARPEPVLPSVPRLLVVLLSMVSLSAHAAPHPYCPGLCTDGLTACGGESDCDGPCTFADTCLPGFTPLIDEVVADGPGGLGDPASWSCGLLRCRADAAGDALLVASEYGIGAMAVKDLVLAPGRRYLLRAELRTDADTWGYFDVSGDGVDARSETIVGPHDWTPVDALFTVPIGAGPLHVRLHVDGPGELGLRHPVVLVLGDYGVYLRFTLLEPEVAGSARLDTVLRHTTDPPGLRPTVCASHDTAGPDCIDPDLTTVSIPAGQEPSAWLPVSAMYAGGDRATQAWKLFDASGMPFLFTIRVRVELAYRPEESAIFFRADQFPGFSGIGLVVPDGVPAPTDLKADTGFLRDLVVADHDTFTPASQQVESLAIGVSVDAIDDFDRYDPVADASLELQRDLGLSVAAFMSNMPNSSARQSAKSLGLTHRLLHAEGLLVPYTQASHDFDLDAVRAQVRANLTGPSWAAERASLQADPDGVIALMGGSGGGLAFSGPGYRAAFATWLAAQAAVDGPSLGELGVSDFAAVPPLEDMRYERIAEVRPVAADVAARTRFVMALRFWNVASARAFAAAADELRAWVGGDVRITFDAGSPLIAGDFQANAGAEFQTMALEGAATSLLGEGFLPDPDDCRAWDLGFYADWARGEAQPWREGSARFTLASYLHAQSGDSARKMLALAGRGFTWFEHYHYGPYDLSTGDGAGGRGALSVPWLDHVARGSEVMAQVEDALLGARREPSSIAILGSQSDSPWTDLDAASADELGWHIALSQAHYPVDVLMESEVEAGRLEGPGAPKRLLIVLRKHLSRAAFGAIRRWVQDGGTLVLGPDLAGWDERDELDIARAEWLGIAAGAAHDGSDADIMRWSTASGIATFSYDRPWVEMAGIGATTVASSADNRPVVIRAARGSGRVVAVGMRIGEAFRAPTLGCESRPAALPARYPTAFPDALRTAIASVPGLASLAQSRPIQSDDTRVSIQRVRGARGPVVIAVAWADAPIDVALSASEWQGCQRVHEVISDVDLPVIFGTVVAPLERAAVITWDPNDCTRAVVAEPADDGAEDVPARHDDGGCGGAPDACTWALAGALVVLSRRRGSARRA